MRKILIRKIGVGSFAKYVGVASAIFGLVAGILGMFGAFVGIVEQDGWSVLHKISASLGAVIIGLVVVPLLAFAWGWVYGGVVSLVANLFLQTANGIELTVEDEGAVKAAK